MSEMVKTWELVWKIFTTFFNQNVCIFVKKTFSLLSDINAENYIFMVGFGSITLRTLPLLYLLKSERTMEAKLAQFSGNY